jgi:hypothetical protein
VKKDEIISLLLILLLAAGLRFAGMTFDSLWLDESYQTFTETIAQDLPDFTQVSHKPFLFHFGAPQPVSALISKFRSVDPLCPPLYAVLLNRWLTAFGQSDLAARSLSAVLSLFALVVNFSLARLTLGRTAAMLAALLQAVSPFDIHYAQEARMYELEMVASALSAASLLWLVGKFESKDNSGIQAQVAKPALALCLVTYAVSTWALINSHYTGLFTVAFQGLFCVCFCLRQKSWRLLLVLAIAWCSTLLLWLPWFGLFRQAASVRTASFYVARTATWWWPVWALAARVPFNWISFLAGGQVVAYAIPLYATSLTFLTAAAWSAFRPNTASSNAAPSSAELGSAGGTTLGNSPSLLAASFVLLYLWCWAVVPPLAVWTLDVLENHRVVEITRYLAATAPAIYILAGYGAARILPLRKWAPYAVVAHAFFALVNNTYAHTVPQREPWKEMAALVESKIRPDEPLLVSQYYDIVCLDRYLQHQHVQIGVSPGQGASHIYEVLAGTKSFWLLTAQEGESVKALLPPAFELESEFTLHHGLHLRHYLEKTAPMHN